MKICIASFSFHGLLKEGKMDAFGYLESVKYRYRLGAADFWNGIVGSTDETHLKKVRQAMDDRELVCANYHVDGVHLWDADPAVREKNYQGALIHLRAAEILGAKTVRVDTGGKDFKMTAEQLDLFAKRYREYAKRAGDNGYKIGPENHWGLSLIADNMEKIANAVDHPAYGILMHIGHWEDGDEEGGDRRMAKWAVHTHVDARMTRSCLEARMRILIDAGYAGYWGVEHHSSKNEYYEVAWQLSEVERVLTGLNVK